MIRSKRIKEAENKAAHERGDKNRVWLKEKGEVGV
jgi:hypothetical protein